MNGNIGDGSGDTGEGVLALRGITKHSGRDRPAFADGSVGVTRGETLGMLEKNGSATSTRIKILAGYHAAEPGCRLWLNGSEIALPPVPDSSRKLGMCSVHHNRTLAPTL